MSKVDIKKAWVRESKFGDWFLNTDTWLVHVLRRALDDLGTLIPEDKPKTFHTILDIGSGFGHSLIELDKRFSPNTIIGLDVDSDVVNKASSNSKKCHANVEFLINNAAEIELPDNSVDMIFCHQTFHHIVDQEACEWAFLSAIKALQERAQKDGMNAVVNITSNYKHQSFASKTEFECGAGNIMAGVALKADIVKLP